MKVHSGRFHGHFSKDPPCILSTAIIYYAAVQALLHLCIYYIAEINILMHLFRFTSHLSTYLTAALAYCDCSFYTASFPVLTEYLSQTCYSVHYKCNLTHSRKINRQPAICLTDCPVLPINRYYLRLLIGIII